MAPTLLVSNLNINPSFNMPLGDPPSYYRDLNRDFRVGFHSFEPYLPPVAANLLCSFFEDNAFSVGRHFDIDEKPDQYILTLELPGFKQAEVDVSLEKGVLTVVAKRKERNYGGSVVLPRGVDVDRVDAKLEDGILTVSLPKSLSAKARKVIIK